MAKRQPRPTLHLHGISPVLHEQAIKYFENGDALGFLCSADNESGLDLVLANAREMKARGMYEAALLHAFAGCRTNNVHMAPDLMRSMFKVADREKLRAAGDPLPGSGPFTVYRGVAGRGRARRVRGFSWTDDIDRAWWFARRFACLDDPAVYRVSVEADAVVAYLHEGGAGREESEFVVLLPDGARPRRMPAK